MKFHMMQEVELPSELEFAKFIAMINDIPGVVNWAHENHLTDPEAIEYLERRLGQRVEKGRPVDWDVLVEAWK